MAYSHGRKFRRLAAQALSADPGEMRALMRRILPPRGEDAAPVLRVESEADRRAAPAAIVAAFFAEEVTADEAAALLGQVGTKASREQVEQTRADRLRAEHDVRFLRGMADGDRFWGREPTPESEELRQLVDKELAKLEPMTGSAPLCDATNEAPRL